MRALFAVLIALACAAPAVAQTGERMSARELAAWLIPSVKPEPASSPFTGDDSCQWANDGECDEPEIGTGACPQGTDFSDCWRLALEIEDDSCQWANDGECDEPRIGTGACTQGTDRTDCGAIAHLRFTDDSCPHAFDGTCDEPGIGTGLCEARTDRADCHGRERPMTILDHFFGHDDRELMDTGAFPWSVIGRLEAGDGGTCTASLVATDVIVTAAHCIHDEGRVRTGALFTTGDGLSDGPVSARTVAWLIDEEWDEARFDGTDEIDGTDWALLRLDAPLGDALGHLGVADLAAVGPAALEAEIFQAGYSWDTGDSLSGNAGCRALEVGSDRTMAHDCDTTKGDSGSPFMIRDGDGWAVVATDSNFRRNPDGPHIYIAALSSGWMDRLADFAAGRIGHEAEPPAPEKPGAQSKAR